MASVQARREKVTDEGVNLVEKDIVPKMATHFESLAEKARDGERESERKRREGENEKAGFVAQVKDKAVVVGWGTAQYTLEKVAEATKAVADITAATTDAVVAAEEKAAEYAAKKQAKALAELEAIRASHSHSHEIVKGEEEEESKEQIEAAPEKFMGMFLEDEQGGSSIFEAIGETIMEIGQTTKAFLLGFNPIQHKDETEEH